MFRNQSVIRLSRQRLCARFYGKYMRACEIKSQGGDSNSLRITEVQVPQPSEGEILVKNEAAGLNFIDCYHRSGLYPRETPFILGVEGAGTVVAAGPNVDLDSFSPNNPSLKNIVGARVGYYGTDTYSEYTVVPLEQSFPLPEDIGWNDAVSVVTQGLTAHYLVRSTYKLDDHDWCLIHACAGGTGQLMVQMAKILGANVIGSCSPSKADVALSLGLDYCIDYSDIEAKVKEITKGRGVDVVYDGVGATTWEASLNSLRPRGMAVFFGNASGPVPSIDPLILNSKGSLFMTRPKLYDYLQNRQELLWRVNEVFDWMRAGKLKVAVDREFNLEDVNLAHEYIESGNTRGKVIIKI